MYTTDIDNLEGSLSLQGAVLAVAKYYGLSSVQLETEECGNHWCVKAGSLILADVTYSA